MCSLVCAPGVELSAVVAATDRVPHELHLDVIEGCVVHHATVPEIGHNIASQAPISTKQGIFIFF